MHAEIITIGDEILIGQIVDTNSAWLGQQLNLVGIDVTRISSINDKELAITEALDNVHEDSKLVIITGGLGPTKDDLTKHVLARYFGMELTYREEVYEHIESLFSSLGRVPSAINKEQALLPNGCRVLYNKMGTAPGMLFVHNGKYFVSLPGVPYEMKHIVRAKLLPIIAKELVRQHIEHRTILTAGVPESDLSERLEDFEKQLPNDVKLAYLPRPGMVRLRLTAKGNDENRIAEIIVKKELELKTFLGNLVFGTEQERLEDIVGQLLKQRGETIAVAESCTGGYIAHLITSIAGSSHYFKGGIVAYDNSVKTGQLGVEENTLRDFGAVSEEVVSQMAEGAKAALNTTWALATSGIAGPDGGSDLKPVGTVWIALSGPKGTQAHKFQFGNNRVRNIKKSAFEALNLLRKEII